MRTAVLAVAAAILVCACSKQPSPKIYMNMEIGLKLVYPGTWQVMPEGSFEDVVKQGRDLLDLSEEDMDIAEELAPLIVVTLVKPGETGVRNGNPNVNVVALELSEEERAHADLSELMQYQIADVRSSIPGSEVTLGVFPLPNYPEVQHYLVTFPVGGRSLTVYHYLYLHQSHYVHVAFTFADRDEEQEVEDIIRSMRIG